MLTSSKTSALQHQVQASLFTTSIAQGFAVANKAMVNTNRQNVTSISKAMVRPAAV